MSVGYRRIVLSPTLALGLICSAAVLAREDLKWAQAEGTRLAYVESGQGQPIVLVHGGLCDYRTWAAVSKRLAERYHVVAYSRRRHHPNPVEGDGSDYDHPQHAADLVALIRGLRLGPVHLVGHSYGGRIAAMVAVEHPELVRSLILAESVFRSMLDTQPDARSLAAEEARAMENVRDLLRRQGAEAALPAFHDLALAPRKWSDQTGDVRKQWMDNARTLAPLLLKASLEPTYGCADFQRLKMPIAWIESAEATARRRLAGRILADCIPGLQRSIVPKSGHGLPADNPDGFAQAIVRFVTEQASRDAPNREP